MKRAACFLILATLLLLVSGVSAATPLDADYDLSWWTVDGGGGFASDESSGYTLAGIAGQADAGALTDGRYTLAGGFWGGAFTEYNVYLPLALRSH